MDMKNIINIVIIFVIIIIIFIALKQINENFDLTVGLKQYSHLGKFDDCYQIGTRTGFTSDMCKDLCNKMDSCVGISYGNYPSNECRLYNDTTLLKYDPRYESWYKFARRKIY